MSIIKIHNNILYGGSNVNIILKPLTDNNLPLLYKWYSDIEVVHWSDCGNVDVFNEESINAIYNKVSQNAHCFLAEINGKLIGETWLQKMNKVEVSEKYPNLDVRRIEITIGEKEMWGQGYGSEILGMLIDFAFNGENTDVLYCFVSDYNLRSQKMFLKKGFVLCDEEILTEKNLRAKKEYHYKLTKKEFLTQKRYRPSEDKVFLLPISKLQPSQLYISEGKLKNINDWFNPNDIKNIDPIPIKYFNGYNLMTDGHTRAVCAVLAGLDIIPVYIDTDELDMCSYEKSLKWCEDMGIKSPNNLINRIVTHKDYEQLWRKRCMDM